MLKSGLIRLKIKYEKKKTILVTGGLGFIGQAISLSLSRNNSVIIIDNNFRKKYR